MKYRHIFTTIQLTCLFLNSKINPFLTEKQHIDSNVYFRNVYKIYSFTPKSFKGNLNTCLILTEFFKQYSFKKFFYATNHK